jgi:glycerol-1-phosphatase
VLTGVADPRQLMLAPERLRPTFIARDLRDLANPMPQPCRVGQEHWGCGKEQARLENGCLCVTDTTSVDSLRAACCLAWELSDSGTTSVDSLELPDFEGLEQA